MAVRVVSQEYFRDSIVPHLRAVAKEGADRGASILAMPSYFVP